MKHNSIGRSFLSILLLLSAPPILSKHSLITSLPRGKTLAQEIVDRGFVEIGHPIVKKYYFDMYYYFDRFIERMDSDDAFAAIIAATEKEFLSYESLKERYCSAPPSYRDPRRHETKRFAKVYFQFIKEYGDIVERSGVFSDNPDIANFFHIMGEVDKASKEVFKSVLAELEKQYPGITQKAYGKHNDLTVITKIVRYEQAEEGVWGTTPHVDKSALTLILNSDDLNDESLLLCEDTNNPAIAKMHKPNRVFNKNSYCTSALLIPGIELLKEGISIMPTVHGVLPIHRPYRHAVISFLLIPDVDMSQVVTDFNDVLDTITVVRRVN